MKPIVEKILASGLIDRHLTKLLETWGYLPEGSVDKVREDALRSATHEKLVSLAEDLAVEFEKSEVEPIKETALEIISVRNFEADIFSPRFLVASDIAVLEDKLGRLYVQFDDASPDWFVPGYVLHDTILSESYRILSKTILYKEDKPVAIEIMAIKVLGYEVD